MLFYISFLFFFIASALAAASTSTSTSTTIQTHKETCTTTFAKTSVNNVPTSTTTKTVSPQTSTVKSNSTPTVYTTPKATTTTTTVTSQVTATTTAPAQSNVFTTTTTVSSTSTAYTTATTTTTTNPSVTSTTTSTSTVVPSGFVSVEQSSNTTTYENCGTAAKRRRSLLGRAVAPLVARLAQGGSYPSSVLCVTSVQTVYVVYVTNVKPTVTSPGPVPVITATSTVTATTTTTVVPPAVTSTITATTYTTITSTSTVQTTATTTGSTTQTVYATTTTTYYEACATPNLLGPCVGPSTYVYNVGGTDQSATPMTFNSPSSYDCCHHCMTTPNCYWSFWEMYHNQCQLSIGDGTTCSNADYKEGFFQTNSPYQPEYPMVVSNGPCAQVVDDGPAPH